jgi:hypothetical protein
LIDKIESVQRAFTKKLFGLSNMSYKDRLLHIKIDSLETRRIRAELVMYYKAMHNLVDVACSNLFSIFSYVTTRGHNLKLTKPICKSNLDSNQFSYRAIDAWNGLSHETVNAPSLLCFKHQLFETNLDLYCKRTYFLLLTLSLPSVLPGHF